MINYYSRIAGVLLPHLDGRPVTFIRFPDGIGAGNQQFFEKNVPNGAPGWLPTVRLPASGSRSGRGEGVIEYALLDEPAGLVWAADPGAVEAVSHGRSCPSEDVVPLFDGETQLVGVGAGRQDPLPQLRDVGHGRVHDGQQLRPCFAASGSCHGLRKSRQCPG
jgi:hypothetical protein